MSEEGVAKSAQVAENDNITKSVQPHAAFGAYNQAEHGGRERFSSRIAFYFTALGAAVGFGNVWRFPSLAKDYGGGAFFVPYLMALFLIGLPLLLLEISLGQYYQTGDIGVFGSFNRRLRGIGLTSVVCSFIVVTYYSMLIAWVINAFFDSFGSNDPWASDGTTGEEAVGYFYTTVIGMDTLGNDLRPTRIVWKNVGYSFLTWLLIWLCLAFGTKWTGRITYFTMGLPIILLFVFLGKAVSLPGASDGINAYIGQWDMNVLVTQPACWSTAVSQIFFSIGVTFGIMTAFGSYRPRDDPATINSCVIAGGDSLFSFIAGFAVFASMGHLAYLAGVSVDDIPYAGFSLVFGTWPVVFGSLPGGEHWVRLLFFDLFLLGIDSGFALLEGGLTAAGDTVYFSDVSKAKLSGVGCLVGFLFSLIYATDAGLIFLDTIDFYINFVMLFVGFLETFAAGWIYGLEEQIHELGMPAVLSYFSANFVSVIVASGLWFGLQENALMAGFLALACIYLVCIGTTCFYLNKKIQESPGKWTWKSIIWAISFKNMFDLRERLQTTVGWLPWVWAFFMKQFIPHLILILFINLAAADNAIGESLFGHYGEYVSWPFQVLGILTVVFVLFLFILGMVKPELYEGLELVDDKVLDEDRVRKSEYSSGKPDATEEVGESQRDVEASAEKSYEDPSARG
jgi:solute carrier family 6 GABA transporter-like protein 1